jgi:adenylate cyclase
MRDTSRPPQVPLPPLERQIVELHTWVVREGIGGAAAATLFDGLCQRLVIAGVPLWRAFVGMPTLHPQWGGYSYTWRRDLNAFAIWPRRRVRGNLAE